MLCVGAFFFLLMSMPSFAQKTTKKQEASKTKTEKVEKNKSWKIREIKNVPKTKPINIVTPVKVNTIPVKLIKKPILTPGLFEYVSGLKKVDVSDTRDRSDHTKLEASYTNATNQINVSESKPVKDANNCFVTTKTLNITTSDFSYFTESSIPPFIKPGVVINYQSILDGRNTINTEPRDPMTVYLINTSAISGLDNLSVSVEDPQNISGINNALGNLTGKLNSKTIPANMSFEIIEINSEKELQYAVTGSYSYGAMVSAKFGVSGSNYSNSYYYLIKFTQNMYNVAADPNTVKFINTPSDAGQLAYVSEVTYGRKGLMMIKTNKSMSEIKAEMQVSANYGLSKGDIQGFVKSINRDSSSETRVFFYGGSSSVAARSVQENDMKIGFDKWVEAEAGNGLLALPISYKVNNLKGEQLKISSVFEQKDRDCVPKKNLKLKVTLLEIEGKNTKDNDGIADYAVMQHIKYTANNKVKSKFGNVLYKTFKKKTPCKVAGTKSWPGSIALACGNMNDQIHVAMNSSKNRKNLKNIMNSVVFEISPEEANDENAKFEVETWVKEYSSKDILMNNDFGMTQKIPIHFVLAELQGISQAEFSENYGKDSQLSGDYNNFENEYTAMTKIVVSATGETYLDAVFRARNKGDLREKAFLFLRFELID